MAASGIVANLEPVLSKCTGSPSSHRSCSVHQLQIGASLRLRAREFVWGSYLGSVPQSPNNLLHHPFRRRTFLG